MGITATLGPQEEEIRKEIRALKRLVLNRYVFHTPTNDSKLNVVAIRRTFTQSPARSSPPLDLTAAPSS